jgi:hypothetical protein
MRNLDFVKTQAHVEAETVVANEGELWRAG